MTAAEPIRVDVDLTNPGQFFACCGLLELADRLWDGAEGWFDETVFYLRPTGSENRSLKELLQTVLEVTLTPLEADNETTSPLLLAKPFDLRLDWWHDDDAGGGTFKTWAGQQKVVTIARATHRAVERGISMGSRLFQQGEMLPDPEDPKKSVAPFYFDARRAAGAHSLDMGFSNDAQKIETLSFPTVEFLCLVGLQRFRARANRDRTFSYFTWREAMPLGPLLASVVACGSFPIPGASEFVFRLLFRTKYLKGFLPATPSGGDAWPM